jgi:hypothetical protein
MHSRDPVIASMHRLMAFAQSVRVRRMIFEIALEPKQTFWNMTMNLLLDVAALEWAKVFGSYSEDTHWTKVIPPEQHDETRAALLQHLALPAEEWKEQRDSILAYRDQFVSHHDVNATVEKLPQYDTAFKAACFMFDRIRTVADQDMLGGIPTSLDIWSNTVAGNMKVIVRKAHAASATLGSNVRSS